MSSTLSVPDLTDAASAAAFRAVESAATLVDGYRPFNEQSMLDLASGRRTPLLIEDGTRPVGAAIVGAGELDLVIAPEHRGRGHAGRALAVILPDSPPALSAWSHGDHPAARVLAVTHRFVASRTLLELRSPLPESRGTESIGTAILSAAAYTATIRAFRLETDAEDWVALNALVFAGHPEQGALTITDLAEREAEPWFDAGDFLIARDASGRMIGYNWLKIEPGAESGAGSRTGEIYVIGVHPDAAGLGLGRALMIAGLARLRERGCTAATLYVDAANTAAVHLYRDLGFADHTVDVQYSRLP